GRAHSHRRCALPPRHRGHCGRCAMTERSMRSGPRVAVIYGSVAEHETMSHVGAMLGRFGVPYDETVISPHRSPRALFEWCAELEPRGIEVIVAGGGVN